MSRIIRSCRAVGVASSRLAIHETAPVIASCQVGFGVHCTYDLDINAQHDVHSVTVVGQWVHEFLQFHVSMFLRGAGASTLHL